MNFEFERQIMRSSLVYRMGCVSAALAVISVSGANTAEVLGAPEVPHAYCYPNGDCCAPPPGAACTLPGVDQGPFTTCLGDLACRMPDDTCVDADAMCCDDIGGTPVGPGTACLGDVACCKPNGSGDDVEELFCEDLGGISRGSGTTCADTDATCGIQGCCISDPGPFFDFCDDVNYYNCSVFYGSVPLGPGVYCGNLPDGDGDGVADVCDNCETDPNPLQEDTDECVGGMFPGTPCETDTDCIFNGTCTGDSIGDVCDNCPDTLNCDSPSTCQADSDAVCDGTATLCGPTSGNSCDAGVDCLDDGYGDACDNCSLVLNPDQENCDLDDWGDACDPDFRDCDEDLIDDRCDPDTIDCDLDGYDDRCDPNLVDCDGDDIANDCDEDIDNDDVSNDVDVCDYTPVGLYNDVFRAVNHPLRGTVLGDMDGDCDVDDLDIAAVTAQKDLGGGPGCNDGVETFDGFCDCAAP